MRLFKIRSIYVFILFAAYINMPSFANSGEYYIQQDRTSEVIKLIEFPDKKDELVKKWDAFLKQLTRRFGNKDYQMAIHNLKTEYDQAYSSFNACIENTNKVSGEYSSLWANDLQQRFVKEYVQKNFDSIRLVMIALSMANNIASCEEQEKESLYREYLHLDAARNYVANFTEFSKTLNKEEKKKLGHTISVAERYLNNFEYPLQSTLSKESLNNALYSLALKTQKDLDPQLIDFFSGQPLFRKPFDLVKALDDLKALQKK